MIPILLTHETFKPASNDIFPLRSNERYCSSYTIMQLLMKVCLCACVCVACACGLWIDWVHLHILSSCPLNRMAGPALEWASEGTLESPLRPHLRICYTNMLIGMLIQLVITRTWVYCSMSAFEAGKLGNCLHIKCATELGKVRRRELKRKRLFFVMFSYQC